MSLFTVEQIELIRRLRNTGITPKQVIQAFESFDRLDHELFRNIPSEKLRQIKAIGGVGGASSSNSNSSSEAAAAAYVEHMTRVSMIDAKCAVKMEEPAQFGSSFVGDGENGNYSENGSAASPANSANQNFSFDANGDQMMSSQNGETQPPAFNIVENPEKLEELLRSGDEAILQDIRQFVSQYSLRQQTIAHMTGVSQPYVSKFLRGETKEISSRIKHIMYNWYLTCLSDTEKMVEFCSDPSRRMYVNDGKVMPQRRERFTFKPFHTEILERFYAQNPYPSQQDRDLLAQACNNATRAYKPEGPVSSREIVSPQVISNWFANRRKEMKKEASMYSPYQIPSSRGRRSYALYNNRPFCNSVDEDISEYSNPNSSGHEPGEVDEMPETPAEQESDATGDVQAELEAINNSVMALVYPYTKESAFQNNA